MKKHIYLPLTIILLMLTGCQLNDDDDNDSSRPASFMVYNAAPNMPSIYTTIEGARDDDEDLSIQRLPFGDVSNRIEQKPGSFNATLNWKVGGSDSTPEFEELADTSINIKDKSDSLLLLTDNGEDLEVDVFSVSHFGDGELEKEDSFALSVVNAYKDVQLDVYYSSANESIENATMIEAVGYKDISENITLETEKYIFYLAEAGTKDVLLKTKAIDFKYFNQYFLVLKQTKNEALGELSADLVFNGKVLGSYSQSSQSQVSFINAIYNANKVDGFSGELRVSLNAGSDGLSETIATGSRSPKTLLKSGDYMRSIIDELNQAPIVTNELTELEFGKSFSQLYFLNTEKVNVNGQSLAERLNKALSVLTIFESSENSRNEHPVNVANVANSTNFNLVEVAFVANDETISTTQNKVSAVYGKHNRTILQNGVFDIFVTAKEGERVFIIASSTIELDAESKETVLVVYDDETEPTGYGLKFFSDQTTTMQLNF